MAVRRNAPNPHQEAHDMGLAFDLATLAHRRRTVLDRRGALRLLGGMGLLTVAACGSDGDSASGTTTTSSGGTSGSTAGAGTSTTSGSGATGGTGASCETIPSETGGPFPADGSNGPNVLDDSGVVRRDITSSYGSSTTRAEGIPLTVQLTLIDRRSGCVPLAGAAVYLWHCDREGRYSLYSAGATNENYLRGVQESDDAGRLTFTSIFPAAYQGRWPHIHFEVYPSLAQAAAGTGKLVTSQLALPQAVCETVYATGGYEASVRNLAQTSLTRDMVFSDDGAARQLAATTGSVSSGYTASLPVPV